MSSRLISDLRPFFRVKVNQFLDATGKVGLDVLCNFYSLMQRGKKKFSTMIVLVSPQDSCVFNTCNCGPLSQRFTFIVDHLVGKFTVTKSLFRRISTVKSITYAIYWYFQEIAPGGQTESFTLPSNVSIHTAIPSLFFITTPVTVILGVPLRVINSIKGFIVRSYSHIVEETLKGTPRRGNGDPSTAVARIRFYGLISAALYHSSPDTIGSSTAHSMGLGRHYYGIS